MEAIVSLAPAIGGLRCDILTEPWTLFTQQSII